VGALLQTLLVLGISSAVGLSVYAVILVSIAIVFFAQAVLALLQCMFFERDSGSGDSLLDPWRSGKGELIRSRDIGHCGPFAFGLFGFRSVDLDLLSMGDEVAQSSGVKVGRSRFLIFFAWALATAITLSFVEITAFVGLVARQMARLFWGWSNR